MSSPVGAKVAISAATSINLDSWTVKIRGLSAVFLAGVLAGALFRAVAALVGVSVGAGLGCSAALIAAPTLTGVNPACFCAAAVFAATDAASSGAIPALI